MPARGPVRCWRLDAGHRDRWRRASGRPDRPSGASSCSSCSPWPASTQPRREAARRPRPRRREGGDGDDAVTAPPSRRSACASTCSATGDYPRRRRPGRWRDAGRPMSLEIEDADPRLGARLEVIAGGNGISRDPVAHVASVRIEAPTRLRDVRWLPARIATNASVRDLNWRGAAAAPPPVRSGTPIRRSASVGRPTGRSSRTTAASRRSAEGLADRRRVRAAAPRSATSPSRPRAEPVA